MNSTEYDSILCVTAGEIRVAGVPLPNEIPDCGWVPRTAMHVAVKSRPTSHGDRLSMDFTITFNAPFRWLETSLLVAPK